MSVTKVLNSKLDLNEETNKKAAWLDKQFAKRIAGIISQAYPRVKWIVQCDVLNKLMIIKCPMISDMMGYHLDLSRYTVGELENRAVFACSEILERYSIPRNRTTDESVAFTLPRNELKPNEVDNNAVSVDLDESLKKPHA